MISIQKINFALRNIVLVSAIGLAALPSHAQPVVPNEGLNATLWAQHSTEARIASIQAYRMATMQLDAALKDPFWAAATEQKEPYSHLPPAIILDLDETVLDNSPYQARAVRSNFDYDAKSWSAWVNESKAKALPGALAFLLYANSRGVQIFYVSNRTKAEEAGTRANLQRLGIPVQNASDRVLLAGEQPDWGSDKSSRRRFVAATHRVLLLLGDDMNDFITAKLPQADRLQLLDKYSAYWGERWILLSNPMYGSWENAVYGGQPIATRDERLRLKMGALDFAENPGVLPAPAPVAGTPGTPNNTPSPGR